MIHAEIMCKSLSSILFYSLCLLFSRVVEIGPGTGAITRVLLPRYPMMTAIEIDQRSVAFLGKKLPSLHVIHKGKE